VLILRRSLSWTKWRALMLLVLGCVLVVSPSLDAGAKTNAESESGWLQLLGYGAVLVEVLLSGFASIYFEKVVKSTTEVVTIWERNFQLGLYSLAMYGSIMLYDSAASERAAWSNWSLLTVLVSSFGAIGGLLVAATLKYADSILKTMAAAGAIVLSTLLGWLFLDGPMELVTCMGGGCAIIAISNFTLDATPTQMNESSENRGPASLNSLGSQPMLSREDSQGRLGDVEMQHKSLLSDTDRR